MRTHVRFRYALIALITLVLTSCIGPAIKRAVQPHTDVIVNVSVLSSGFYSEYDRWPTDLNELLEYALAQKTPFSTTNYSEFVVAPQSNGSLKVTYTLAPPRKGDGTLTLGKPDITRYK